MSLSSLLQDIDVQKEKRGLVLDADSIVYTAAYKHKESNDAELVYMDFIKMVGRIESEIWKSYEIEDTKLGLTSNTNFRYDLYPDYKANRAKKSEEAELLSQLVKRAKRLLYDRLKPVLLISKKLESDDWCIHYATSKNYLIAAIDNDVVSQSPTPVFNYHKKHWNWSHQGVDVVEINKAIISDSISGKAKDGVKGIIGLGKKKANIFTEELFNGEKTINDYINLFDTPEDMLLSVRLCSCHQYDSGKLELLSVQDVFNMVSQF